MRQARIGRARRTRALTLLEVIISATIVAFLALVMMAATVPMSSQSSEAAIAQDMDRTAARVLADLRRELRQSGYLEATAKFGKTTLGDGGITSPNAAQNQMIFAVRTDAGDTDWSTTITFAREDGDPSTYSGVPGTFNRYKVVRTQNGLSTVIAEDVEDITFYHLQNDRFIHVELTLLRPNPNWTGSTPPPPIRRSYREDIEMMNRNLSS